jgi:translation initiation factor 2 beta subunit (eIF-2beta)/eIF-5
MSLNINGKITDNFYRYKMDKIAITQTGRGGNCHTVLDNLDKISNQINTAPELLLQYIGMILGCNANNASHISLLKGHYTVDKIQETIYQFINFATLCQKCTIPELVPTVIKDGKILSLMMRCSACGQIYELKGNNKNNDKLIDNIIKYYTNKQFVANKGTMVTDKSNRHFNPFE